MLGAIGLAVAVGVILIHWHELVAESRTGAFATLAGLLVTLVVLYGYWRMKRWSVVLLGVALVARVLYSLAGGVPLKPELLGPGLILLVGLVSFRRMH